MSINGLQSAVLEAGGRIEDRMLISDFPNFTPVYTFTREALEKMLENERERCAKFCETEYEYYGYDHVFAHGIRALGSP